MALIPALCDQWWSMLFGANFNVQSITLIEKAGCHLGIVITSSDVRSTAEVLAAGINFSIPVGLAVCKSQINCEGGRGEQENKSNLRENWVNSLQQAMKSSG